MAPSKELIDELYRDEIRWARSLPPAEKLLDGPRLFDRVCRVMADGIRAQFPHADDAFVQQVLSDRLAIARRLENQSVENRR